MSAKIKRYKILLGIYKGKECTLTKKKAREGNVIVNIIDGPHLEISKTLIK